ncbi:hypothetical protein BKA70DRAFT_1316704 [Coprinopsis sp. MPI-PUGE-AT-0042]|nr:hypothetical protein BKA70DRAFT_1316704 [Coprinopsis sp. MPI-PUGE-AT-0042]
MSEKVSHILPLSQLPCANLQDQGSVGHTPAVDLLNLQSNEGDSKRDYNYPVCRSSGDLRNVLKRHGRDSLNKFIDVAESSQEPSTLTGTPNTRGPLGSQITEVLKSYQQPAKFAAEDAIQEIHRRREDPQWNDFRETRLYFRLRPSHRVAFRKARHTGLVLPFGASSKAFKAPNSSLFTPTGGWLLTAEVDPLHGWK